MIKAWWKVDWKGDEHNKDSMTQKCTLKLKSKDFQSFPWRETYEKEADNIRKVIWKPFIQWFLLGIGGDDEYEKCNGPYHTTLIQIHFQYFCHCPPILRLQPCGSHVGGKDNRIFSRRIYMKIEFSSQKKECFCSWPPTWPPWHHVQSSNGKLLYKFCINVQSVMIHLTWSQSCDLVFCDVNTFEGL